MPDKITDQASEEPEENDEEPEQEAHIKFVLPNTGMMFGGGAGWAPTQPEPEAAVTPDPPFSPDIFYGVHVIKEMTRVQMVEEMMGYQREAFTKLTESEMRLQVANARLMRYRERLAVEIGMDSHGSGLFGG